MLRRSGLFGLRTGRSAFAGLEAARGAAAGFLDLFGRLGGGRRRLGGRRGGFGRAFGLATQEGWRMADGAVLTAQNGRALAARRFAGRRQGRGFRLDHGHRIAVAARLPVTVAVTIAVPAAATLAVFALGLRLVALGGRTLLARTIICLLYTSPSPRD